MSTATEFAIDDTSRGIADRGLPREKSQADDMPDERRLEHLRQISKWEAVASDARQPRIIRTVAANLAETEKKHPGATKSSGAFSPSQMFSSESIGPEGMQFVATEIGKSAPGAKYLGQFAVWTVQMVFSPAQAASVLGSALNLAKSRAYTALGALGQELLKALRDFIAKEIFELIKGNPVPNAQDLANRMAGEIVKTITKQSMGSFVESAAKFKRGIMGIIREVAATFSKLLVEGPYDTTKKTSLEVQEDFVKKIGDLVVAFLKESAKGHAESP